MRLAFTSLILLLAHILSAQVPAISNSYNYRIPEALDDGLKTETLGSVGMNSEPIITLTELILANHFPNIHSLLIAKDGKLVYENYFAGEDQISGKKLGYIQHSRDDLHDCRSISKSVVSACIGIALGQGLIKSMDDPIFNYLGAYKKYKNKDNSKITIRHLLTMTSGLKWNENVSYAKLKNSELRMNLSFRPTRYVLKRKITSVPGTQWNYSGGDTHLLAEIIKAVSGMNIDQFAEKNLFTPLGIKKYAWLPLILKHSTPASFAGLRLTSRDMLKIGLLYKNAGRWKDSQVLDSAWANASLSKSIDRPNKNAASGYGYQFWTYSDTIKGKVYDFAEAKGNGGNAIFICKSLNLVVIITAGNYNQWNITNNSHRALADYIIPSSIQ